MGRQGRVVIPADVRRELGIEPGTKLAVLVQDGGVMLLPREAIKRRLREMFSGIDRSLSEELIAERHAEARRDAIEEGWDV